jgi:hypothetical protein
MDMITDSMVSSGFSRRSANSFGTGCSDDLMLNVFPNVYQLLIPMEETLQHVYDGLLYVIPDCNFM